MHREEIETCDAIEVHEDLVRLVHETMPGEGVLKEINTPNPYIALA